MFHTTEASQVSQESPGRLVAEASSIGLAPGEWPEFIAVMKTDEEGSLFHKGAQVAGGGYEYWSRPGWQLVVLND